MPRGLCAVMRLAQALHIRSNQAQMGMGLDPLDVVYLTCRLPASRVTTLGMGAEVRSPELIPILVIAPGVTPRPGPVMGRLALTLALPHVCPRKAKDWRLTRHSTLDTGFCYMSFLQEPCSQQRFLQSDQGFVRL